MKEGSTIINSASVTAYKGSWLLLDYAATKERNYFLHSIPVPGPGGQGMRVNAVAPGPIWTPLIPSTSSPDEVQQFGSHVPMKRIGQPEEGAPSYVFPASSDSSYMTGLHPNGGTIVNE